MKKLLFILSLFLLSGSVWANNARTTFSFDVQRASNSTKATKCPISQAVLGKYIGVSGDLTSSLQKGTLKILANYFNSSGAEKFYSGYTADPYGYWFTTTGMMTNKEKSYCIKVTCDGSNFNLEHNAANAPAGNSFEVREAIVKPTSNDTLVFVFNVSIGNKESVTTDQPQFFARKSYTDDWQVTPVVQKNSEEPVKENIIQVHQGDKITLGFNFEPNSKYSGVKQFRVYRAVWNKTKKAIEEKGLSKYISDATDYVVSEDATTDLSGRYIIKVSLNRVNSTSSETFSYNYYVDVQNEETGTFHTWNAPQLSYDFRSEYPTLDAPKKLHKVTKKSNGKMGNCYAGKWWAVYWGDDLNSECGTDSATINGAAKRMIEQYEYDFGFMRDSIGWPPDLSARKGYKSFVYIFGSGLSNDNESKTTQGGYQSSTYVDGGNYACVWASYYPFSRFREDADKKWSDGEYQRNAMIHEGIHATFADLNACQGSSWFHEGGNTWLQGQCYAKRDGVHGDAGFLDGGPFLAPHMPIECYSGWLQDGSYGGPAAQGVNMYDGGKQVCTWRTYLGGVQYANAFPTVIANVCGEKSIAWIWRYCKNRVLETMGDTLGDAAMREIILQYRARQALFDLGGWDKSYRNVTNSYFGTTVKAEWSPFWIDVAPFRLTPYQSVKINDASGWMAPDTLTNPGWSGGNIIPIHVSTEGGICEVDFRPEDTNMMALLCYRTKDGRCFYSHPVHCGTISIDLSEKPANGVVFCVVVNTDYIYTGDAQRKHHWDYRIRLGQNAWQVADVYQKWYMYEQSIKDPSYDPTGIEEVMEDEPQQDGFVKLLSGNIHVGDRVRTELSGIVPSEVSVRMIGVSGVVVRAGHLNADGSYEIPDNIPSGFYVLTFSHGSQTDVYKVVIK